MNTSKYLARIGLENPVAIADIYNLKLLQRQHLLNVPFENLDIHWQRPIALDTERFYRKIVEENRGGYCYELNGLFNELLRESGFETRLLSACVSDGKGGFSDEYDHLAILVIIGEMQYLADVGFGAFAAEPLQFVPGPSSSANSTANISRLRKKTVANGKANTNSNLTAAICPNSPPCASFTKLLRCRILRGGKCARS